MAKYRNQYYEKYKVNMSDLETIKPTSEACKSHKDEIIYA